MQDEVNEKVVALSIKTSKLTAEVLQKAMKAVLAKGKQQLSKAPHGKITMRQLMKPGEKVTNIEITDANIKAFDATDVDRVPNPQYVRGTEREVLELLNNFFPSGQTIQLADMFNSEGEDTSHDFSHTEQWLFYSLGITIITTAIGIGLYRRKEIK